MADEIRSYGPGKFNTILDSAVWNLAQDGVDEELADQGYGWRGKLTTAQDSALGDEVNNNVPDPTLNPAEIEFLNLQVGAILTETTDGHVDVEYFEDAEALQLRWAEIESEFAEFAGDEEGMDPGDQDVAEAGDDVPLLPLDDNMLAQAKADGVFDAQNHGATVNDAPNIMRTEHWEEAYGYSQATNPEKMGALIDAWRSGVAEGAK
jgi:hypothetical protein